MAVLLANILKVAGYWQVAGRGFRLNLGVVQSVCPTEKARQMGKIMSVGAKERLW
jgi:hypothetical protein